MTAEERLVLIAEHCAALGVAEVVLKSKDTDIIYQLENNVKYSIIRDIDNNIPNHHWHAYLVGSVTFYINNAI